MDGVYRDEAASVDQLAGALAALGMYGGDNTTAEHAAEADRLGADRYRMHLANSLLGAVQAEAMLCEGLADGDAAALSSAHREQLRTGGAMDPGSDDPNPEKLSGFLRWQALRVAGPLREIAQDSSTGPIPLAAAHAAEGLQRLLGVIAAGQVPSVENVRQSVGEMRQARQCLQDAIKNVDILLEMLSVLGDLDR